MKVNPENIRIAATVIKEWLSTIHKISYLKPIDYLRVHSKTKTISPQLSLEKRIILRKVLKAVKIISPIFRKSRKCLIEALVVHGTLTRFGVITQIHFGVKKNGVLKTHAWLSADGKIIVGAPIQEYEELLMTH